jgi:hypothetical protein
MPVTGARRLPRLRSALWLPLFADLVVVARLAGEAEEAGWHGVFVWDQVGGVLRDGPTTP